MKTNELVYLFIALLVAVLATPIVFWLLLTTVEIFTGVMTGKY